MIKGSNGWGRRGLTRRGVSWNKCAPRSKGIFWD
jgi:hypothetical protein